MASQQVSKEPANIQKIYRESKIGFVVFLVLFSIFAYFLYDRITGQFGSPKNTLEDVPVATVIPPEQLALIRRPDFVLPSRPIPAANSINNQAQSEAGENIGSLARLPLENQSPSLAKSPNLEERPKVASANQVQSKPETDVVRANFNDEKTHVHGERSTFVGTASTLENSFVADPKRPIDVNQTQTITKDTVDPAVSEGDENEFQAGVETTPADSPVNNDVPKVDQETDGGDSVQKVDGDQEPKFLKTFPSYDEVISKPLNLAFNKDPLREETSTSSLDDETTLVIEEGVKIQNPIAPKDLVIESKKGDTFWSLAERVYGEGRLFRALYEANKPSLKGRDSLPEGTKISFPTKSTLFQTYRHLVPNDLLPSEDSGTPANFNRNDTYETQPGDSLFSIARDQFGQASRYLDILELNKKTLPAEISHLAPLKPETLLKLPAK